MADRDFLAEPLDGVRPKIRILLIEDDAPLARELISLFSDNGWVTVHVATIASARDQFKPGAFDLLVADRALPDGEGLDYVAELRKGGVVTPILMLTSMSDTTAAVEGLDRGADDYLGKLSDSGELVARVRALARRNDRAGRIVRGALEIDLLNQLAFYRGRRIKNFIVRDRDIVLTDTLFRLLAYMAINSPDIVTRDMLLINVWRKKSNDAGMAVVDTKTADVHLTRLRAVLKAAGMPELIEWEEGDPMGGLPSGWRLNLDTLES